MTTPTTPIMPPAWRAAQEVRLAIAELRAQGVQMAKISELSGISRRALAARMHRHREYVRRGIDPEILPPTRIRGREDAEPDPEIIDRLRRAYARTVRPTADHQAKDLDDPKLQRTVETARRVASEIAEYRARADEARNRRSAAIKELRAAGLSYTAIAEAVGVSTALAREACGEE